MSDELTDLISKHFPGEENSAAPETPAEPPVAAGAAEGEGEPPKQETSSEFINRIKSEKQDRAAKRTETNRINELSPIEEALKYKDTDPRKVLELLGISMESLENQEEAEPADDRDPRDIRLEKIEKEREQEKNNQLFTQMMGEVKEVTKGKEEYELVNAYDAHNDVLQLIYMAHEEGQQITYEAAAGLIEAELEETIYGGYDKLVKTKKYASKYTASKGERKPSENPVNITNTTASQGAGGEDARFNNVEDENAYLINKYGL